MKRRKGLFLLDAMLGLLILSSLSIALYPLLGQAVYLADWAAKRGRMIGEGLYVMDEMTEHLRNDLKVSQVKAGESYRGNRYTYYAYNQKDKVSPYTFYVDKEKLYLNLYGETNAPLTGESSGKVESFAFQAPAEGTVFERTGIGPIHISFQFSHQMSGEKLFCETSILPYADYYEKRS